MGLDGVFGGSIKRLDPEMLFDPLEKQFHLPTAFVQLGDRKCRQSKIVGQKTKTLAGRNIEESNPAKFVWIIPRRKSACKKDGLIAQDTGSPIDGMGV